MTQPLPIILPKPEDFACRNCNAWSRYGEATVAKDGPNGPRFVGRKPLGLCRANPPAINPKALTRDNAVWPVVSADDWCREHRRYRGEREEAA